MSKKFYPSCQLHSFIHANFPFLSFPFPLLPITLPIYLCTHIFHHQEKIETSTFYFIPSLLLPCFAFLPKISNLKSTRSTSIPRLSSSSSMYRSFIHLLLHLHCPSIILPLSMILSIQGLHEIKAKLHRLSLPLNLAKIFSHLQIPIHFEKHRNWREIEARTKEVSGRVAHRGYRVDA